MQNMNLHAQETYTSICRLLFFDRNIVGEVATLWFTSSQGIYMATCQIKIKETTNKVENKDMTFFRKFLMTWTPKKSGHGHFF